MVALGSSTWDSKTKKHTLSAQIMVETTLIKGELEQQKWITYKKQQSITTKYNKRRNNKQNIRYQNVKTKYREKKFLGLRTLFKDGR